LRYANIIAVTTAQLGWYAAYASSKYEKSRSSYHKKPLACWATVTVVPDNTPNVAGATIVVGLVEAEIGSAVLDFADALEGFLGYDYPGCERDWGKLAADYRKEDKKSN
jgi:hypothetical protein